MDGRCIYVPAGVWGRRSTIYYAVDGDSRASIKEYYLHQKRRFDEAELLDHIHADGDVLGVRRLKSAEDVEVGDACGSEEAGDKQTKRTLVLYDAGLEMSKATSINSILEALYDVLEVHRTLVRKRGILHGDVSIHNILMSPSRRTLDRPVMEDRSPFIGDMLQGRRPEHTSTRDAMSIPRCLLIDFDNACRLRSENEEETPPDELTARTGTPKYIAAQNSTMGTRMPKLSGRALELYQAVRGTEHYERYSEKKTAQGMLIHGGLPPRIEEIASRPEFYHRPEHDGESVFWTMFAVLARAQPASGPQEEYVPAALWNVWKDFDAHEITSNPTETADKRDAIFGLIRPRWREMFAPFPAMQDVADLLFAASRHVSSEYALWKWVHEPEPDHLHEAVQRLIFQYLVDHPDDIALDPARRRPVDKPLPNVPPRRNPVRPLPLPSRGDDVGGQSAAAMVGAGTPAMSSGGSTIIGSSGKAPAQTSSRLQMVLPTAQSSQNQRNAEPVPSVSAGAEEGAGRHLMGTRSRSTSQVAGPSPLRSSDAADDHVPPGPPASLGGARSGQAFQSSRAAAKRTGDDLDESAGGVRKRRKR